MNTSEIMLFSKHFNKNNFINKVINGQDTPSN